MIGVLDRMPCFFATVRTLRQSRNGDTCVVTPVVATLEESNDQALSGKRRRDLRRGSTRANGMIDMFVVLNVSYPGVVVDSRGTGGATRSSV